MSPEAKELLAFFKAILENPMDAGNRFVFADWLEEHDEPEEADLHRREAERISSGQAAAEQYIRTFCEKYSANYEKLVKAVREGEGYCFGDEDGPYAVESEEFWENMEILTGDNNLDTEQTFRCAC